MRELQFGNWLNWRKLELSREWLVQNLFLFLLQSNFRGPLVNAMLSQLRLHDPFSNAPAIYLEWRTCHDNHRIRRGVHECVAAVHAPLNSHVSQNFYHNLNRWKFWFQCGRVDVEWRVISYGISCCSWEKRIHEDDDRNGCGCVISTGRTCRIFCHRLHINVRLVLENESKGRVRGRSSSVLGLYYTTEEVQHISKTTELRRKRLYKTYLSCLRFNL